ncbi:MAG: hypothetical protein ABR501_13400, partial [Pyrinomonadaceae bacterium]
MIPGIAARDCDPDGFDLEICLGEMPAWFRAVSSTKESWYVSPDLEANAEPRLAIWKLKAGAYFYARYADGTEFLINRAGSQ